MAVASEAVVKRVHKSQKCHKTLNVFNPSGVANRGQVNRTAGILRLLFDFFLYFKRMLSVAILYFKRMLSVRKYVCCMHSACA